MNYPATGAHRHVLSYHHVNSSGPRTRPDGTAYLATYGTCRDCLEAIYQLAESGDTLATNRRPWVAFRDLREAYAANAVRDALANMEA